jgi:hypothetical protein
MQQAVVTPSHHDQAPPPIAPCPCPCPLPLSPPLPPARPLPPLAPACDAIRSRSAEGRGVTTPQSLDDTDKKIADAPLPTTATAPMPLAPDARARLMYVYCGAPRTLHCMPSPIPMQTLGGSSQTSLAWG